MIRIVSLLLVLGAAFAQTDHASHGMTNMPDLNRLSGRELDRTFLSLMIPHHQGAVAMAQFVLPRAKDAKVKAWAQAIVKTQQAEIKQMTEWLKPLGGASKAGVDAMKMDMDAMLGTLRSAPDPQRAFVEDMIPHHQSAIDMAKAVAKRSANPKMVKLAQAIITAQTREIAEFRKWLAGR